MHGTRGDEVDYALLLDGNVEAEGKEFYSVGALALTPDQNRLAALMDFAGDERYAVTVRDIATGETIAWMSTSQWLADRLAEEGGR